jgi:CubicO group peptidase (beta-lactamase class C family)
MIWRDGWRRLRLAVGLAFITSGCTGNDAARHERDAPASLAARSPDSMQLAARIAVVKEEIEARRVSLGVPGAAVVVVRDDRVILLEGFGVRDVASKRPVTPSTLFSIGSCTKPFTALALAMSADAGRLSLDDHPRKYLPWFTLRDRDANAAVTLRDLLSHRTGVPDDLGSGWFERYPSARALITVAMGRRPSGRFRRRFNYNNYMFLAAGEALAAAHRSTFDSVMARTVLEPLGMTGTQLSTDAMTRTADFSSGHSPDSAHRVQSMDTLAYLSGILPAAGIHSNATDMARWLRLMLGAGKLDGKRLLPDARVRELLAPAVRTSGASYGLGLFIEDWHGQRLYHHPGDVPGFATRCDFVPAQRIGWVVLTNVSDQTLPKAVREIVYEQLIRPR